MKCIEELVNEVYSSCKIPFQLIIDESRKYSTPQFEEVQGLIENKFYYNNTECCIKVNAAFRITINLLELCIKEKLKGVFLDKKNIISLLLNGDKVDEKILKSSWPVITKEFDLINIYIENYREEILLYIKELYLDNDIDIIAFNKNILMFGNFEDVLEHAKSIKDTLESMIPGRCYISYCKIENYKLLKSAYEDSKYKINLGIKYNIIDSIFDANKLILEGIIDSISDEMKQKIYDGFKDGISKLDSEMIKTMEVFFKCGLNLSEAAKELYIHRNTLIYRLDKIEKYTNYDIREFNEAVLLKIIFFIWKEKIKK